MPQEAVSNLDSGSAGQARSSAFAVADYARTYGKSISKGRTHVAGPSIRRR